jgi:hypothetical protein
VLCLALPLAAQGAKGKMPARESGYRVIAVDRVVTDQKTGISKPAHCDGMKGFVVYGYSNDHKHVLVEYIGASFADHAALRQEASAGSDKQMLVIEKALTKPAAIQAALTAAGFPNVDLSKFMARVK